MPKSLRSPRTVVVGGLCFILASMAVRADTLMPTGVPPGQINAIADAADQKRTVKVTAAGELAQRDQGSIDRLDALNMKLLPLSYGPDGLRVAAHGSVTVNNLPQTQ